MKRKLASVITAVIALAVCFASCGTKKGNDSSTDGSDTQNGQNGGAQAVIENAVSVDYSKFDLDSSTNPTGTVNISLNGANTVVNASGVSFADGVLTITASGTYSLTGSLDGRIVVKVADTEKVRLVLNSVTITCRDNAAIFCESADKLLICLAEGTVNTVIDSDTTVESDGDTRSPSAIYSCSGLTFNGTGTLNVSSTYKHAVATKKTLKVVDGTLNLTSVGAGLKGNNAVALCGGQITINANGDGIKTEEVDDTEKGYIAIEGGNIKITTASDGLNGSLRVSVTGGTLDITTTGTKADTSDSQTSSGGWFPGGFGGGYSVASTPDSKGIKAGNDVTITGGKITVVSTGHAIHSKATLNIGGDADLVLSAYYSGAHSKGLAAHGALTVAGGKVNITRSYEGIESKTDILICGGDIDIVSSDDGMNAGTSMEISGGDLFVKASGDGLDSNGNLTVSGGTEIISQSGGGNGALDKGDGNYQLKVTGGILIAYGSSSMVETPTASVTTQNSVSVTPGNMQQGQIFSLRDSDGNDIVTFSGAAAWQNVVISSPAIKQGTTLTVYTGGSCTGTCVNGVYSGGEYSGGTQTGTLTINSVVTGGRSSGGGPGGGPGGGFPGGRR